MKREEEREICKSIDPRRLEKISSGGLGRSNSRDDVASDVDSTPTWPSVHLA